MIITSHQSDKLSQLQNTPEAGRASPLLVTDRLELRRLADALFHAWRVTDSPEKITDGVDMAVAALKRFKANLRRRIDARDGLTSKRLIDLPEDSRANLAELHCLYL